MSGRDKTAQAVAALIRYREAFRAANPGKEPPSIMYHGRGWYKIGDRGPLRRLRDFVEWTERLEQRPRP